MSSESKTDVCVAGGGPSGLATAIACAQRGLRVTLVEAAEPPLDKACGEGLMPRSLQALAQLGVSIPADDGAPFAGIRFIGPEHRAEAVFGDGVGYGVRRTLLHERLCQRAQDLGVRMLWGTRFIGLEKEGLRLDGGLVRARWVIGADGLQSRVRGWAGLDQGRVLSRRIGIRRHYGIAPWSRFVEIYWGRNGQAYVTPVGTNEVCVAYIAREKASSFSDALGEIPELEARLAGAPFTSAARGAVTLGRKLRRVSNPHVALVGDAAGSVDSITGEGLAIGFQQALRLADAIVSGDIAGYDVSCREIGRVPQFMSQTMLLMDRFSFLRRHTMRSFDRSPQLFARMLQVHVGESPLRWIGSSGVLHLGWQLLNA